MSVVVKSEESTRGRDDSARSADGRLRTPTGIYPGEWRVATLGALSAFITKGSTPTTFGFRWQRNGVLFLRSECVAEDGLDLRQSMFMSTEAHKFLSRSEVRGGDILMTITGNVGRVVLLEHDFGSGNINQHIARIRIAQQGAVPAYVHHFLNQPEVRAYYESITTGQAYPQISLKQVRETSVVLPDETEQRAIASALSDVDALIAALDRVIEKKRAITKAAMQRLLTGQSRLLGFDAPWRRTTLGDEATFHKGKGLPKSALNPFGQRLCIHYGELFTEYGATILEVLSRTDDDAPAFLSVANDVLMPTSDVTPRGLAKASCIPLDGVILGGDILVIRPSGRISGSFLSYLIRHEEDQVLRLVRGTTVFHLYASDMRTLVLSLPSLKEQEAIVEVLDDAVAEVSALEVRREKTHAIKTGMMQALLTGRVRLQEPA